MGGTCAIRPVNDGRMASICSRLTTLASPEGVSSPSRSPVSEVAPKVTVARYVLGHSWTKSARRVAALIRIGRTPSAAGSRVPPWPALMTPGRRRTARTMAKEDGPAGLLTLRIPDVTRAESSAGGLRSAPWPRPPSAAAQPRGRPALEEASGHHHRIRAELDQLGGRAQRVGRRVVMPEATGIGQDGDVQTRRRSRWDLDLPRLEQVIDQLTGRRGIRPDQIDGSELRIRDVMIDVDHHPGLRHDRLIGAGARRIARVKNEDGRIRRC